VDLGEEEMEVGADWGEEARAPHPLSTTSLFQERLRPSGHSYGRS
jgi:hypothetical protein